MESYYSHSRLSSFAKCPKAYEFAYIREIPEAFQTIEKHLGSAVHQALEWTYRERTANEFPPLPSVLEQYRSSWEGLDIAAARIVKAGTHAEDYFRRGQDLVRVHYERAVIRDLSETLRLEHDFEISLDEETPFRGIIDRISRQPTGVIRLSDYKTGRLSADPFSDLQLPSYSLFAFSEYEVDLIEICYEDLRTGRTLVKCMERAESGAVRSELLRRIATVKAAATYPASPSVLCSWCGYVDQCPEGSSRRNGRNGLNRNCDSEECPECGAPLRQKNGRFGPFLGCSEFPACRYTRNL